ncbi:MAG TPA: carboxymuconolactone decarboxylase family protein, partial [Gammaproteobacteria bacterium]
PETSTPLIEFHEVLLRGPSPFTATERELIAAYVSGLNRCDYCHGVHTATAERMGVEAGLLPRIVKDGDLDGAGAKLRPILTLARKLTLAPDSVTKADADAVFAAGWDDTALYHAIAVSRFMVGVIGFEPTAPTSRT